MQGLGGCGFSVEYNSRLESSRHGWYLMSLLDTVDALVLVLPTLQPLLLLVAGFVALTALAPMARQRTGFMAALSMLFCTTMVTLAKTLSLVSVAEGVETTEQRDFLQRAGCDLLQGWLFSRAVTAVDILPALKDGDSPCGTPMPGRER